MLLSWPDISYAIYALAGIGATFIGTIGISLFKSPKLLDDDRAKDILERDSTIAKSSDEIASLKTALTAKHPHDEHKEVIVREALAKLDEAEVGFLRWLLNHGRVDREELFVNRFTEMPITVISKTRTTLMVKEPVMSTNGLIEQKCFYYINTELKTALQSVLYPHSIPVRQ